MKSFPTVADLAAAQGEHLGYSDWHEVTPEQVATFADVTGDRQWIHLDAERAAQTQFGGTIVHGYLTLALVPVLMSEIVRIGGLTMAINVGLNRVRFPAPVKVGSRVRGGAELLSVKRSPGGYLSTARVTVQAEGHKHPGCVAETVSLYVT